MSWKSINFNAIIPSEVTAVVEGSTSLIDQYLTLARTTATLMKTFQGRLGGGTDVVGTALKALIDSLEGFLQLGKVHVLFVPMAKVYPDRVGALGGNDKFFSIFSKALKDEFDPNRPQYTESNDAVVMSVAMAGAPSYAASIEIAAAFNRIFHPPSNSDLAANTVPTPQNLRAKAVAHPSSRRVAVRLEWDAPKALFTFPFFPGVGTGVKRYAVIRSTDQTILNARSVLDLFNTRTLSTGMTSTDKKKVHKVVAVGTGANSTFVDKGEDLDPAKSYYYAVAWELTVTERGKDTVIKFDKLSNVVKTRVLAPAVSETGNPPNWSALPSLAQLVPALADSTFLLTQQLRSFSEKTKGSKGGLSKALTLGTARLDRIVQDIDSINTSFKRLKASIGQPIPTIHGTTFSGVGGNDFLLAQLSAALHDESDINRPPFDDNEYVLGVCIVAGGPRIPDIQPIIDFLTALFGGGDAPNPLLGILEVVDGVVATVETAVLGEDLQPLAVNDDGTVQLPDGTSVDPSTIDPNTGVPFPPATPVTGLDGTTMETSNPANPQAGETNVTPLSELC
jgi:hypothetical protein